MEFQKIEKVHQGHFISRYDITYKTVDGKEKVYEMISRDKEMEEFTELSQHETDAVVVIVEDEARQRILLNREYRMAVGGWVYNFPAGLIDAGETPGWICLPFWMLFLTAIVQLDLVMRKINVL